MTTITYGDYVTSPIPNTTMQEVLRDGVLAQYRIQPLEGFALHDKRIDNVSYDDDDNKTIIPSFKFGDTTVSSSYDFDNVTNGTYTYTDENGLEVTIPVEMMGMYEFYTLPEGVVPIIGRK